MSRFLAKLSQSAKVTLRTLLIWGERLLISSCEQLRPIQIDYQLQQQMILCLFLATASSLFYRGSKTASPSPGAAPGLNITTRCSTVNLTVPPFNHQGVVRTGYLSVGRGNSALAFIFYGKLNATESQLTKVPTVIWLNGGPGSSSQLGNFMELGPHFIARNGSNYTFSKNAYTWASQYNVLFVDQPVGTGLSYADESVTDVFVHNMSQVEKDFYNALKQLYNSSNGCFNQLKIPDTAPLFIFGESYAGKYVPAIASYIVSMWSSSTFLKGLKGAGIGDGFTHPEFILRETPSFAFNLGLLEYTQRSKLERNVINNTFQIANRDYREAHDSFDDILDEITMRAGGVNVYNIRLFKDYDTAVLGEYFEDLGKSVFKFERQLVFGNQSDKVYQGLYDDFMRQYVIRVEYLLTKNFPVLIYNGQNDLIVPNPGTMRWVDLLEYEHEHEFRAKTFQTWRVNNRTVGVKKEAGKLGLRIVFDAGHLVPMDQPLVSLSMLKEFVAANLK